MSTLRGRCAPCWRSECRVESGRHPARKQDVDRDWPSHHRKPARYSPRGCTCVSNRNRATYKCSCYAHRGFTPYKNNAHTSHMVCAAPGRGRGGVLALLAIFTVKTVKTRPGPRVFARFFKCMDTPFRVPFRFATYKYMLSCACVIPSPSPLFSATTEHCCAGTRARPTRSGARVSAATARDFTYV